MNRFTGVILFAGFTLAFAAGAADDGGYDTFGKWRLSVGGAFNGAVRGNLGARNLPVPASYVPQTGVSKADAKANARNRTGYDNGGFIAPDADTSEDGLTKNWELPRCDFRQSDPSAVAEERGNGRFYLHNSYYQEEIVGSSVQRPGAASTGEDGAFGVAAEVSRELWCCNEAFENRWGVDFAAAFSYFFRSDLYKAAGRVTRNDRVRTDSGSYETVVDPQWALYEYFEEPPARSTRMVDGVEMFGEGWGSVRGGSPLLAFPAFPDGEPMDMGSSAYRAESSSLAYAASGDYRELEMLFMFRPWYEITDWWRVYGELGVGVSWGRFETDFCCSNGLGLRESFDQWDVYGVGGLGTMFRCGMFDLSLDFLGRFLRDDMDVDGRYVKGSIQRADWGFRVMVGVEF